MKKVFISGGSRGIGKAAVYHFAENGWEVGFSYCNSLQESEEIVRGLSSVSNVHAFRADLSSKNDVCNLCSDIISVMGEVDVLVNNAGVSSYGLFTDVDQAEFDRVMGANFHGAFFLTKALVPAMIRKHTGKIINISSVWGQCGSSCEVLYSASKAALIGFTKALAKELAPSGIAVNCIAPGVVDTDMMASFSSEERREIAEDIPSFRFATSEEIAQTIFQLANDTTPYLTGQVIGVNGGMYC